MTEEEHALLNELAARAGKSVSDWLRDTALLQAKVLMTNPERLSAVANSTAVSWTVEMETKKEIET